MMSIYILKTYYRLKNNIINRLILLSFIILILSSCSHDNVKQHKDIYQDNDSVLIKKADLKNDNIRIREKILIEESISIVQNHSKKDTSTVFFTFRYGTFKRKIDPDILISINYTDNKYSYKFSENDFISGKGYGELHTITVASDTKGKSIIDFKISKLNETLASGILSVQLKNDWARRVGFDIGNYNFIPNSSFGGRTGYVSYPVLGKFKTSRNDSLYIIWGGNSISRPVIY